MFLHRILGCLTAAMLIMTSLPTTAHAATAIAKKNVRNSRHHKTSCSSSSSSSSSSDASSHKDGVYDYVIVGNGTSGAVLARKLSNNRKNSVLVLEAGPNLSHDPEVLNPVAFANLYDLTYNPKYAETYPIPLPISTGLLQAVTYGEGRMWGGSSAHNYLLAVHGTPGIYDSWAAVSGNPRWTYTNILPIIRAVETYTPDATVANYMQRGNRGPVFVTQNPPVDSSVLAQDIATNLNAPLVADYNDPTTGNVCTSTYQQFITPPPNSQRSFSIPAYLPDSVITPEGKGLKGRDLRVISETRVNRILFDGNKAIGVEAVLTNGVDKAFNVFAKKKVIVCAGGINSPALLQRSGIGDATLLNSLDIPVLVNNPNVGANLSNQYGAITVVSGTEANAIQAMINLSGDATYVYPNDDVRRVQYLTNPGVGGILGYGFIEQPNSRGSVTIVSKNPFIHPLVDLGMYTDAPLDTAATTVGTDANKIVTYLRLLQNLGVTIFLPTPDDYLSDDALFAYAQSNPNIIITDHITGTCRMSTSALDGVVDGDLNVFGTEHLMVADLSVAPVQPDGNPCYPTYVIANEAARILGAH
ncbi:MAG: GMC family oxidoreductase [Chlamydiales bacterium]|nr:GMC family oxidoreductase [Chlamydiales bacterium]